MKSSTVLATAMQGRYEGPIDIINKGQGERNYIPWTAMVRHLDSIYDWDGWSAKNITTIYDGDHKCYTVSLELEVHFWDDTAQCVRSVSRPGVSGATVRGGDASDAAGGARSLALVNAARSLGDAFGLYLTPDKTSGHSNAGSGSNGTTASGDPASEAQKSTLRKCKVPEQLVRGATKAQASGFFDRIFEDKKTGAYKYGHKFTNDEAIAEVWGAQPVGAGAASDDMPF